MDPNGKQSAQGHPHGRLPGTENTSHIHSRTRECREADRGGGCQDLLRKSNFVSSSFRFHDELTAHVLTYVPSKATTVRAAVRASAVAIRSSQSGSNASHSAEHRFETTLVNSKVGVWRKCQPRDQLCGPRSSLRLCDPSDRRCRDPAVNSISIACHLPSRRGNCPALGLRSAERSPNHE